MFAIQFHGRELTWDSCFRIFIVSKNPLRNGVNVASRARATTVIPGERKEPKGNWVRKITLDMAGKWIPWFRHRNVLHTTPQLIRTRRPTFASKSQKYSFAYVEPINWSIEDHQGDKKWIIFVIPASRLLGTLLKQGLSVSPSMHVSQSVRPAVRPSKHCIDGDHPLASMFQSTQMKSGFSPWFNFHIANNRKA